MTIPQETIDKIKADAEKYSDLFKHGAGYRELAYADGATEWAGKAQALLDLLEESRDFIEQVHKSTGMTHKSNYLLQRIIVALAKYKEVSNG